MKKEEYVPEQNDSPQEPSAPRDYILDAFALMAYLDDEAGADQVADLILRTPKDYHLFMSLINLGEVAYNTERDRGSDITRERLFRIRQLPIAFINVTENRILAAAHVKAKHRVSYADAFAIALAQELNATIVTGDPEFKSVEKMVDILWLLQPPMEKKTTKARERRVAYRVKSRRKQKHVTG